MNVIVVGAGKVGYIVAERLSREESNNVMVIENDAQAADKVASLNVSLINDTGSNPRVLSDAMKMNDPDVIISTVARDEDNLFICMIAKNLKPEVKTIARIRNEDYISFNEDDKSIKLVDEIFSPENSCAEIIKELAILENAIGYDYIDSLDMVMATFLVTKGNNVVGKTILEIQDIPEMLSIVSIYRGEDVYTEVETFELHVDDRICVLGTSDDIKKFNKILGIVRDANEFVILGATAIGVNTAIGLEKAGKRNIRIIETDPKKCSDTLNKLDYSHIMNGNTTDPHLLSSENVGRADVLMVLDTTDEVNLLASLMGRNYGSKKIISEFSMPDYESIFKLAGIQSSIGFYRIIANDITKKLISDEEALVQMRYSNELFFSLTLNEKSPAIGKKFGDIKLPQGCRITHVIRDGECSVPRMDTEFRSNDKILLFSYMIKLDRIQKIFKATISAV